MAGSVRGSRAGVWGPLGPVEPHLGPSEPLLRGQIGVEWSLASLPSHHMSLSWASLAFLEANPSQLGSVPAWLEAHSGAERLAQGIRLPVLHARGSPQQPGFLKRSLVNSSLHQPPALSFPPSCFFLPPWVGGLPVTLLQDQTHVPCPLQLSSCLFCLCSPGCLSRSLPVTPGCSSLTATASLRQFFLPLWVWLKCHLHLVSSLH